MTPPKTTAPIRLAVIWGFAVAGQASCTVVLFLAARLARHAYKAVIPGELLPRATECALRVPWLFLGLGACLALALSIRSLRTRFDLPAQSLALFLLGIADILLLASATLGYLLPFALMNR